MNDYKKKQQELIRMNHIRKSSLDVRNLICGILLGELELLIEIN